MRTLLLQAVSRLQKLANHPCLLLALTSQPQVKQERDIQFAKLALGDEFDAIEAITTAQVERLSAARAKELASEIVRTCGKLQVLQSLFPVWRERGNKVLLFSKSTQMLTILEKWLALSGYSYLRFDGSIPVGPKRQRIIDQFSSDDSLMVLLISTGAGSVGLNITAANIVVIFDRTQPD